MVGEGTALFGRSKGPYYHYWFLSLQYLSQSSPTHVCAFIPAPAARVVSSCHLCPDEGSSYCRPTLTPTHYSQFCAWSVRYRVHYRYMSRG